MFLRCFLTLAKVQRRVSYKNVSKKKRVMYLFYLKFIKSSNNDLKK